MKRKKKRKKKPPETTERILPPRKQWPAFMQPEPIVIGHGRVARAPNLDELNARER